MTILTARHDMIREFKLGMGLQVATSRAHTQRNRSTRDNTPLPVSFYKKPAASIGPPA